MNKETSMEDKMRMPQPADPIREAMFKDVGKKPMEETKEKVGCLCFGKDTSHCPIHKLPNKEECKNCKSYPDGDYGECGDCHRMITQFPTPVSPSDKTWEVEFDKDFCEYLPYRDIELLCWKGIKEKNMNLIPTARTVKQWIEETLTSATIKARREERLQVIELIKRWRDMANIGGNVLWYTEFSQMIENMEKFLEQPKS